MPVQQKIKNATLQAVTNALISSGQLQKMAGALKNASPEERIKWLRWLAGVTGKMAPFSAKSADFQKKLNWIADWMEQPGNNASAILERVLNLNPQSRDKFLLDLVARGTILGAIRREEIFQTRGFAPYFVVISPLWDCNLIRQGRPCSDCYAMGNDLGKRLPFEVLDSVCDQMSKAGCGFITITGGEPYLYYDKKAGAGIWDLFAKHPNIFFQTYTNGCFLANEKAIARLLELGNVAPSFSIEGFEKETVARRCQDTWNKVMLAMELMREAKLPFGFSATVTRDNIDIIATDEFVDYWIEQGCLFGWTFILIPIGSGEVEHMLLPEQRDRLRHFTTIYARRQKKLLWFDFWNDGCLVDGCIAGGRHCHIMPDGRVSACVFSPFAASGYNVKDQPLLDILEQAPYFKKVREYIDVRKSNPLLPCMVIDEPWHLKYAVEQGDAEPNFPGAEKLIMPEMTRLLDAKSAPYRAIAAKRLAEEYPWAIKT